MKILITGANGFVGSHLIDQILGIHHLDRTSIFATSRRNSGGAKINHPSIVWLDCDVEKLEDLESVFINFGPFDKCFHFASKSSVRASWASPVKTFNANVNGTINLLECIKRYSKNCVVLLPGSSEQYGGVDGRITEDVPMKPMSPYAISKVAQESLGRQYFEAFGIKTILTRAFNHEGPGRSEDYVVSSFAKQIVEIKLGLREPVIYHGNLSVVRTFTDVRDIAGAYLVAATACGFGEVYNVCSEFSCTILDVLDLLASLSGIKIEKRLDGTKLRPIDAGEIVGDSTKFRSATGWEPQINIEQTLRDTLAYWNGRISAQ